MVPLPPRVACREVHSPSFSAAVFEGALAGFVSDQIFGMAATCWSGFGECPLRVSTMSVGSSEGCDDGSEGCCCRLVLTTRSTNTALSLLLTPHLYGFGSVRRRRSHAKPKLSCRLVRLRCGWNSSRNSATPDTTGDLLRASICCPAIFQRNHWCVKAPHVTPEVEA